MIPSARLKIAKTCSQHLRHAGDAVAAPKEVELEAQEPGPEVKRLFSVFEGSAGLCRAQLGIRAQGGFSEQKNAGRVTFGRFESDHVHPQGKLPCRLKKLGFSHPAATKTRESNIYGP